MKVWSPDQKTRDSRFAPLLSCRETHWLLPRNKSKPDTKTLPRERKPHENHVMKANEELTHSLNAAFLGSKKLVWILCLQEWKLQMGRAGNHLLRAIPGPSGSHPAHCTLTYPTQAPPFTWSHEDLTDSERKARGAIVCNRHVFSAGSIASSNFQTSLGCRVRILPIALQRFLFFSSHASYWPLERWPGLLLSEVGKGCNKDLRSIFPSVAGEMLEVGLVVRNCTEIELLCWT